MNIDLAMHDLFTRWQNKGFEWGKADCCQFALDASKKLHGHSVGYIAYTDESSAIDTLNALGGFRGILGAFCHKIEPRKIKRGDFVLVHGKHPFNEAMAVFMGNHAYTTGRRGLVSFDRSKWIECWTPGGCNA